MAISPATQYPAQIDATDGSGYPWGKAQNVSAPGDGSGFPLEKAWVNDWLGMQQAALRSVALAPSGTPDRVGASQVLDAIVAVARRDLQLANWAYQSTPDETYRAVTEAGSGLVIAAGLGAVSNNNLWTSPDGTTWTARTADGGFTGRFSGVAWSEELTRAAAVGAAGEVQFSADGISWVAGELLSGGYTGDFQGVAWSPGLSLFTAVGESGEIQTSPFGSGWTARTADGGFTGRFSGVAWSPGLSLFTAVGESGEIQTSPDGIAWTHRANDGGYTGFLRGVSWSVEHGAFIAVGNSCEIQTSTDGVAWVHRFGDGTQTLFAVTYSPTHRRYVAVGQWGFQTSLRS